MTHSDVEFEKALNKGISFFKTSGKLQLRSVKFLFLVLIFLTLNHEQLIGQANSGFEGSILKNWEKLHISNPSLQISYNVMVCGQSKKLGLRILNQTSGSQQAAFKMDVFDNRNGDKIFRTLNISLLANQELIGDCQNNETAQLLIDLTGDVDPNKIYVAITF